MSCVPAMAKVSILDLPLSDAKVLVLQRKCNKALLGKNEPFNVLSSAFSETLQNHTLLARLIELAASGRAKALLVDRGHADQSILFHALKEPGKASYAMIIGGFLMVFVSPCF